MFSLWYSGYSGKMALGVKNNHTHRYRWGIFLWCLHLLKSCKIYSLAYSCVLIRHVVAISCVRLKWIGGFQLSWASVTWQHSSLIHFQFVPLDFQCFCHGIGNMYSNFLMPTIIKKKFYYMHTMYKIKTTH